MQVCVPMALVETITLLTLYGCDDVEVLTMTFSVLLFKKYPLYFNSRSLSLISMEDCNMSLIQISKLKI